MAKATYSEAWQLFLQILPYPSISGKSGRIDRPWTFAHPPIGGLFELDARSKSPRDPFAESRMPLTTQGAGGIERKRGASNQPKIPALSRHRVLRSPIRIISAGPGPCFPVGDAITSWNRENGLPKGCPRFSMLHPRNSEASAIPRRY